MGRFRRLFVILYAVAFIAFVFFALRSLDTSAAVYADEASRATGTLEISSIGLSAPVSSVEKSGKTLNSPEQIAGAYSSNENKTLLIGHSSTIFANLDSVKLGDTITYNGKNYTVKSISVKEKAEISMQDILKSEDKNTIVLMTCSGKSLGGQDYSHRLIITAD